MRYARHETDRKPNDKRTRRLAARSGKRAFLNSCL